MSFSLLNFPTQTPMDLYAKMNPINNQVIGLNTTKESIFDESMSFSDFDESKIKNLSIKPLRTIKRRKHVFDPDLKILDIISKEIHLEFNEENQKANAIKKDENYTKEILLPKKCAHKQYKWSYEENEMFYKAIDIFGTDFSLIQTCLPAKTRKEIKVIFL